MKGERENQEDVVKAMHHKINQLMLKASTNVHRKIYVFNKKQTTIANKQPPRRLLHSSLLSLTFVSWTGETEPLYDQTYLSYHLFNVIFYHEQ